jgi:hypothetical protein
MILLVCESRKLHNISHFSLFARLVRLARIFLREASLIFHKIFARKNYETRLAVNLSHNIGLLLPKTTSAGIFTRIKREIVKFLFLFQVFFVFAIFVFSETRFFHNLGSFAKLRNSRNSPLIFAKHENRFVASFAKQNFVKNPIPQHTFEVSIHYTA